MPRQPPHDFDDPPAVRTTEDRKNEIVEKRLGRGLLGAGLGFGLGVGVVFVDDDTGKWMVGGSVLLMAAGGYYILRTLIRRRRKA